MKKLTKFAAAFVLLCAANGAKAQKMGALSGAYPIPSTYFKTLAEFIDTINTYGVKGAVTANLTKDQTAPSGGYVLGSDMLNRGDSQLTLTRSLTINGNGYIVTAPTGTGNTDGIFKIQGADFVTINDLNLQENSTNTTATTMMEWGYAVVKRNADDGVKTLTIQRCTVTLNKANTTAKTGVSAYGATGIFIGNCLAASTAKLAAPSVDSGAHDGIFLFQDTIANVNNGVYGNGNELVINGTNYNDNGVTVMSNDIRNFTHNGVALCFFNNDLVQGNFINNMTGGGAAPVKNDLIGISYTGLIGTATNNSWSCTQNKIDLTTAGDTVLRGTYGILTEINGSGTTSISEDTIKLTVAAGATSKLIGIFGRNATGVQTITKNVIQDFSAPGTNKNHIAGIWNGQSSVTPNGYPDKSSITQNLIRNFNIGRSDITAGCIDQNVVNSVTTVFTDNTISDLMVTDTATALKGYQFRNTKGVTSVTLTATGNRFINLSGPATTVPVTVIDPAANPVVTADLSNTRIQNIRAGKGPLLGMQIDYGKSMKMDKDTIINLSGAADVYAFKAGYSSVGVVTQQYTNGLIDSLATSGTSSTAAAIGITPGTSSVTTTVTVSRNVIRRIYAMGTTGLAYGMNVVNGTATYNINDNMISDVAAAANTTAYSSSFGINLPATGVNNIYYNTINLVSDASPASGYGATGYLFSASGTNTVQNNIFRVNVISGSANNVSAVRSLAGSASAAPALSGFTAARNIYSAPTGAANFLYVEGTLNTALVNGYNVSGLTANSAKNITNDTFFNSECDKSSYHKFMKAASATREAGTFTEDNLSGTDGIFTPSGITYAEAAAIDIPAVGVDLAGDARPVKASDIGAREFSGTLLPKMNIALKSSTGMDTACVYNLPKLSLTTPAYFARLSYQWYRDTVLIAGATGTSIIPDPESAVYTVKAYDSVTGCTYTSTGFHLTIMPPPPAGITYYDRLVICETSAVVLHGNSGAGYTYQWYKDGLPLAGETRPDFVAAATGVYTVEVNTVLGCPSMSGGVSVTVYPLPAPTIFIDASGRLSTQKYYTYQWYRNGKIVSGAMGQTYSTRDDGAYTVIVTDSNGCTNKSTIYLFSVGISENQLAASVHVFPNPVSGMLHIESPVSLSAVLSDLTGRVVMPQQVVKDLDMSAYAEGMYLLQLYDEDHRLVMTEKISKSR